MGNQNILFQYWCDKNTDKVATFIDNFIPKFNALAEQKDADGLPPVIVAESELEEDNLVEVSDEDLENLFLESKESVKLETSLVNKDNGASPDYTGAQVNGYTDGYTKSTITVSDFSQVNTAFAKYTIVSFQESTNNVVIGYEVDLSYADSSININDYFEVLGRFTTYEVNSPSGSGYSLDSTIEIYPDSFVYFWVSVSMKKVPPVALSGVSITITLTYNAK